jgi:hypothetical protein
MKFAQAEQAWAAEAFSEVKPRDNSLGGIQRGGKGIFWLFERLGPWRFVG